MVRLPRRTTLLLACVLALLVAAPATALAAPSSEQYKLELPSAGSGSGGGQASGPGSGSAGSATDRALTGIAADSADDGGLPILLVVLVGTAATGAGIAIMRRRAGEPT